MQRQSFCSKHFASGGYKCAFAKSHGAFQHHAPMDALTGQGQGDVSLSTAATLAAAERERKATQYIRSQIPCGFCTAAGMNIETELPF